jgi:hypothetical protein
MELDLSLAMRSMAHSRRDANFARASASEVGRIRAARKKRSRSRIPLRGFDVAEKFGAMSRSTGTRGSVRMLISAYTVQKIREGYWVTRLAPAGDRSLPTNLQAEPTPLRSVARAILDDCGYVSHTDDAQAFAERFLFELSDARRGVVTIAAPKIDLWVASHQTDRPL